MASAKKQSATKTALEVGAGLAVAAAAAGAGYYFYGDTNAKKHRAAASKWAKDMKGDVVREAKKLKKIDEKTMASIVDKASKVYSAANSVDRKDIQAAARELKKHWRKIAGEVRPAAKKSVKSVKKTAKTVKKAGSKTAAKAKKTTKRAR